MEDCEALGKLKLTILGGPFHRAGKRVGLVRAESNTMPLGLALGIGFWSILATLAIIFGATEKLFSVSAIAAHIRLLVVVPLFFLCEAAIAPRMSAFVTTIAQSGVVRDEALPSLHMELIRLRRWTDAWLPDALCVLGAAALSLLAAKLELVGNTAATEALGSIDETSLPGRWYWFACLPLFRFLMLRWIWRILLWCFLLRRLSKLSLALSPIHPDHAGGLGYLEVVQTHFALLALAASALVSASLAEDMASGEASFGEILPTLALNLVAQILLIFAPPCVFLPKLKACQMKGLSDYSIFSARYAQGFERKWLKPDAERAEPLLGTSDLQSLADLSNSVAIVRNMRWAPVSTRLLMIVAGAAFLPMAPLLLFEYPVGELTQRVFGKLIGL
jgi:hypothetical protein